MAAVIAAITYLFQSKFIGANYGDLPDNFVGWAAVFVISFYCLSGIDDHIGVMKILNVAHGSFYAWGAYTAAFLLVNFLIWECLTRWVS